jgi:SAM-dependent methyltransferase
MVITKCIICGNNTALGELYPATYKNRDLNRMIYSARRIPDRVHYRIVKCGRCGMVFSSPILPPGKIASLYRESICTYADQLKFIRKTYLELFDKVRDKLPGKPKILEVGCGNGFFLTALSESGIRDVWGVEPGTDMVRNADPRIRKNIKADIFRHGQFPENSFDLVCCFHTLDHLTDPALFVKEAFAVLKPGGLVLVVTHDTEGLSVMLFGERSPIFDIEHIYLFSKTTVSELFGKYGFVTQDAFNLVNRYPLSYWLRMSGLPQKVKDAGQKVLTVFGLSDVNFSLAGGNIAYIGQKPGLS